MRTIARNRENNARKDKSSHIIVYVSWQKFKTLQWEFPEWSRLLWSDSEAERLQSSRTALRWWPACFRIDLRKLCLKDLEIQPFKAFLFQFHIFNYSVLVKRSERSYVENIGRKDERPRKLRTTLSIVPRWLFLYTLVSALCAFLAKRSLAHKTSFHLTRIIIFDYF